MKLFADTAIEKEVREAFSWGVVEGATTNPSLVAKIDGIGGNPAKMKEYLIEVVEAANGNPISIEVTALDYEGMVSQGRNIVRLFGQHGNVNVKVPVCPSLDDVSDMDAIRAIKALSLEGIPVNATLIFTLSQALMAAKAGAKYVSPFVGRIDDELKKQTRIDLHYPPEGVVDRATGDFFNYYGSVSGIHLVARIVEAFRIYKIDCQVISASIRDVLHVEESALVGAHIATVPFDILQQMVVNPKTVEGMKKFTADVVPEYEQLIS